VNLFHCFVIVGTVGEFFSCPYTFPDLLRFSASFFLFFVCFIPLSWHLFTQWMIINCSKATFILIVMTVLGKKGEDKRIKLL